MSNTKCDMPECIGSEDDEVHRVADPANNLLKMCQSCLDSGWKGNVEILH